jgi:hypothetical protein
MRWREVEGETRMAIEPFADLWVLMGGIIVEDDVDGLFGRNLSLDLVEEADELLMPMLLHAASNDLSFEHIEGGKQGGGAVALIVVGHGGGAPLLQGQTRLGAVERLDLAHMGICGSRCSDQDSMVNLRSLLRIQGLSPFA